MGERWELGVGCAPGTGPARREEAARTFSRSVFSKRVRYWAEGLLSIATGWRDQTHALARREAADGYTLAISLCLI